MFHQLPTTDLLPTTQERSGSSYTKYDSSTNAQSEGTPVEGATRNVGCVVATYHAGGELAHTWAPVPRPYTATSGPERRPQLLCAHSPASTRPRLFIRPRLKPRDATPPTRRTDTPLPRVVEGRPLNFVHIPALLVSFLSLFGTSTSLNTVIGVVSRKEC